MDPIDKPAQADHIEKEIKLFIDHYSKLIKSSQIDLQTSLFTSGLLDSLAYLQLVARLEKTFHIKLPRTMARNISNLDSIEKIITAIQQCPKQP